MTAVARRFILVHRIPPPPRPEVTLQERAKDLARALVRGVSGLIGTVGWSARRWVESGDVTAVIVLVGIALILLVLVVIPSRRPY